MPVLPAHAEAVSVIAVLMLVAAGERLRPRFVKQFRSPLRCVTNVVLFAMNSLVVALPLSWLAGRLDMRSLSSPAEVPAFGWALVWVWIVWLSVLDLASYVLHRCLHSVPLLFRIHCAHHSDDDVDLTTAFRRHPIEFVFNASLMFLVGVAIGAPIEVSGTYGILAVVLQIWHHGNVALPGRMERFLATIFVTPALHRSHHALDMQIANGNFGTVLSIWDRIFGTLRADAEPREFGVPGLQDPEHQRLGNVLRSPVLFDAHTTGGR